MEFVLVLALAPDHPCRIPRLGGYKSEITSRTDRRIVESIMYTLAVSAPGTSIWGCCATLVRNNN